MRALLVATALSTACAGVLVTAQPGTASSDGLDRVRAATARFHDLDRARAAGFTELRDAAGIACIEGPDGGMGVHQVDGDRVADPAVVAEEPELLVYAPDGKGRLRLAAVEYVVLADAWHGAGHDAPPSLFRRAFRLVPEPNRYGLPAFYELHAWVWQPNPAGTFADENPRVDCP